MESREIIALELIKKVLNDNNKFLDFGSGDSYFCSKAGEIIPHHKISGIDYSDYKIKLAKKISNG